MAVFRIEKTQNYTVISNHHLRNAALTLKAKGLLSQMLSLPDTWDYTLKGLTHINRESLDAIRSAVQELERAGYILLLHFVVFSRYKRNAGRTHKNCSILFGFFQILNIQATSLVYPFYNLINICNGSTSIYFTILQDYTFASLLKSVRANCCNLG